MTLETEADDLTPAAQAPRFRFPLVYVFYAMTVLASALATFGAWGMVPAVVVLASWAFVFASNSRPNALNIVIVLVVVPLIVYLLLPAVQQAREASRRMQCQNNMKQLALALYEYEVRYGSFPPAYVADSSGKPMHSWRVLVLPFIEQERLYKAYNFNEPWNGPNNSKLATPAPLVFQCPQDSEQERARGVTDYYAVVGANTIWPGATGTKVSDITDGISNTLLVVESRELSANWLEPRDLAASDVVASISRTNPVELGTHHVDNFFYEYASQGRVVAMADGSTRFLRNGLAEQVATALVERADGREIGQDDLDPTAHRPYARPRYDNWFRLGCFVLLVLFPLPWVWIHPAGRLQSR